MSTVAFRLEPDQRSGGPTDRRQHIDGLTIFDIDVSDVEGHQKGKEVFGYIDGTTPWRVSGRTPI